MQHLDSIGLTLEGCRDRQHVLREYLRSLKLQAALIVDRRHVHYLTGYWTRAVFAPMALVECEGPTILVTPTSVENAFASDENRVSQAAAFCTLVDDQAAASLTAIQDRIELLDKLGCDGPLPPATSFAGKLTDLSPTLRAMRRCKDEDELAFMRQIVQATETVYQFARESIRPGVSEIELWSGMLRTASECVGETLGEFGNDFQIGAIGSPPRRRPAETGETAILDLSLSVRGYHSDLCRTFVVGGEPNDAQRGAHAKLREALDVLEKTARPGASCRAVDAAAREMLDGFEGFSFFHHLGHGVGLNGHEAPRLNPLSEDRLQVGDVFTMEPGLYGESLRAGIRLEQMYHVGEKGIERLSSFPLDL